MHCFLLQGKIKNSILLKAHSYVKSIRINIVKRMFVHGEITSLCKYLVMNLGKRETKSITVSFKWRSMSGHYKSRRLKDISGFSLAASLPHQWCRCHDETHRTHLRPLQLVFGVETKELPSLESRESGGLVVTRTSGECRKSVSLS